MSSSAFRNFGIRATDKAAKAERVETAFQKERDRIRTANAEKTTRLRGLRMAKEASEREAAAAAAVEAAANPPPPKKTRARKPPAAAPVEKSDA